MIHEHRFDSRESLYNQVYGMVVDGITDDLQASGQACLLLSGGASPQPLYQRLSTALVDWQRVTVALVDERWVEPDHPASNERLIRQTLRQNNASECALIGMKTPASTPFAGERECQQSYANLTRPYTFCLLGMGDDGHIASLFPHAEGLEVALHSQQLCAGIQAQPSPTTSGILQRMTMTPWAFLQATKVVLLILGEEKWQVYQQAREPGPVADMPVRALWEQPDVDVEVFWAP